MTTIEDIQPNDNGAVSLVAIENNFNNLNDDKAENSAIVDMVVGPSSATDNAIARYDGTTGKIIQDSANVLIGDNGEITQNHTATEDNDDAITQNIDIAGYTSVSSIQSNVTTGNMTAGDASAIYNIAIDNTGSTGGSISAMFINQTGTGSSIASGVFTGQGMSLVGQFAPTLGEIDEGLVNAADETTDLNNIGVSTAIFTNNGDTVTIGEAAIFEQMEFILGTGASFDGVQPTYEYSTGVGTWTAFTPQSDIPDGFKQSGLITWDADALAGWAVGTGGNFLIRITRTESSLTTTPVCNRIRTGTTTINDWDENGLITTPQIDSEFLIDSINSSPIKSLNTSHQLFGSTGNISGGFDLMTDSGDGTIDVLSGGGWIRATDSINAPLLGCTWVTQNYNGLTDNALNYICLSYVDLNTDPAIGATNVQPTDFNTNICIGTVYKEGNDLKITNTTAFNVQSVATNALRRWQETEPFAHVSGAIISAAGTSSFNVSAGRFWEGADPITTISQDFSGTDTYAYYYKSGSGGWLLVDQAISAVTFTGSGLDDATSGGTFIGSHTTTYKVEIDGTGTPDTFTWYEDGVEQAQGVAITGGAQTLRDGVEFTFAATTGHTLGDYWEATGTLSNTINLTQYDAGTGILTNLSNNQYGNHWVYVDIHGHIAVVFGVDSYTLGNAQDAPAPETPPSFAGHHYNLAGRIIVEKGVAVFEEIDSVFDTIFTAGTPTIHNNLGGLNDGDYKHLTAAEYTANAYTNIDNAFSVIQTFDDSVDILKSATNGDMQITQSTAGLFGEQNLLIYNDTTVGNESAALAIGEDIFLGGLTGSGFNVSDTTVSKEGRMYCGVDEVQLLADDGTDINDVRVTSLGVENDGFYQMAEIAAPATPATGEVRMYAKTDGLLYSKDDAGTETALGGGGGGGVSEIFDANIASSYSLTTSIVAIPFNTENIDTGGNYNNATYIYTAPSTGNYRFDITLSVQSATDQDAIDVFIYKNGSFGNAYKGSVNGTAKNLISFSFVMSLTASDTIGPRIRNGNASRGSLTNERTTFSGYKLD